MTSLDVQGCIDVWHHSLLLRCSGSIDDVLRRSLVLRRLFLRYQEVLERGRGQLLLTLGFGMRGPWVLRCLSTCVEGGPSVVRFVELLLESCVVA